MEEGFEVGRNGAEFMFGSYLRKQGNIRGGPEAAAQGKTQANDAMLAAERLPHALLVSGPEGIGKHELALKIAQAVVCESSPAP